MPQCRWGIAAGRAIWTAKARPLHNKAWERRPPTHRAAHGRRLPRSCSMDVSCPSCPARPLSGWASNRTSLRGDRGRARAVMCCACEVARNEIVPVLGQSDGRRGVRAETNARGLESMNLGCHQHRALRASWPRVGRRDLPKVPRRASAFNDPRVGRGAALGQHLLDGCR